MEGRNPGTGEDPYNPPTGGGEPPSPPTGERDPEGERAWLAQLDRKVGTRTYAGAAAIVLALAAGIVAIVLAVDARDNSATKGDLNRLERELTGVAEQAGEADEAQESIDSLSGRLDELEDQVGGLSTADSETNDRLGVIEDDIEALRQQISDLDNSSSGGGNSNSGGVGGGN